MNMLDAVLPPVAIVLPGNTPAEMADAVQRTKWSMRDRLMRHYACTETMADEIASLCIDTLRVLTDEELVHVRAAAQRSARAARNAAIRREIRPGNAAELARRYNLTEGQVYRIVRAPALSSR